MNTFGRAISDHAMKMYSEYNDGRACYPSMTGFLMAMMEIISEEVEFTKEQELKIKEILARQNINVEI